MPLIADDRLGPYTIVARAGAGGMGEVYQARDTRLGRTVAIKLLPEHLASDPEQRQRLEREARIVAGLSHPHICALFDIGNERGVFFLVLEYLEGETLAARLRRGALPLEQTLHYAAQIADALDSAHQHGLIHRDLKPGNIMLTSTGAKLLDFGLAKPMLSAIGPGDATFSADLTEANSMVGTLQYMAPEQLEGKPSGPRSDVFAMGAVLYEMASGRKAFEGDSHAAIIAAIVRGDRPSLTGVPSPALQYVIDACLASDPKMRWQNARDLVLQLRWIESATGTQVDPIKPKRPRGRWIAAGALGLTAAIVAGVLGLREKPAVAPA